MDEALALPTEEAVQVALRTQQILAHESGVADTVDPLAGSYFLESLTDEIEARALAYIEKIDALGGALAAVEQGYIQREIQEAAYRHQKEIEQQQTVVVGVNRFASNDDSKPNLLRVDDSIRERQVGRLARLRQERDAGAVAASLDALAQAAQSTEILMPYLITAVEAYTTTGEICQMLRRIWGEYQPAEIV